MNKKQTYIVMVRGGLDDVPILVTNDSDEAIECAESADWNSGQPETDIIGVGMNCPVAVAIYIFDDTGRLEAVEQIKDLEDLEESDDE